MNRLCMKPDAPYDNVHKLKVMEIAVLMFEPSTESEVNAKSSMETSYLLLVRSRM